MGGIHDMKRLIFSPRSGYIRPGEALVSGRRDVDPSNEARATASTGRSLPPGRLIRHPTTVALFQESARNGSQRAKVTQGLASEGIAKADSGNKEVLKRLTKKSLIILTRQSGTKVCFSNLFG